MSSRDSLRIEMEVTLSKFEAQMRRALQTGTTTPQQIEKRFERMNAIIAANASKAAVSQERVTRQTTALFNVSRQGRFVLQNTAAQFGDIAVQAQMGTDAMRIMGQQVPQILGGFGAMGGTLGILAPLLGTVAAVGFPIAGVLLAMGDGAEDSAEKVKTFADKLTEAKSAIDKADEAARLASSGGVEDLREIYGSITAEVAALADALAEIDRAAAKQSIGAALGDVFTEGFADAVRGQLDAVTSGIVETTSSDIEAIKREIALFEQQLANAATPQPEATAELAELRRTLALMIGDFQSAGDLAAGLSVAPADVARFRELATLIPKLGDQGQFEGLASSISEMREIMRRLGVEEIEGVLLKLTQIEDMARQASLRFEDSEAAAGDLADAASRVAPFIGDANAEAVALAGNLRNAMAALAGVVSGIQSAQRRALNQVAIKQSTVGQPVDRAGLMAREDFNERSGAAAYSVISRGASQSRIADLAAQSARVEDGARNIAAAEESLRAAEKAFSESLRGSSKSGSGKSSGGSEEKGLFEVSDTELTRLQRQIDLIGRSQSEIAALTAKYQLLDEAKRRNLDLDAIQQDTGETLIQQIERQSRALGEMTERYNSAASEAQFYDTQMQAVRNGTLDAILEGESLVGTLANVAKAFARASLEAYLFGTGVFGEKVGGVGLLSPLVDAIFDRRALGGPGRAGQPYLINENTPRSEIFVPSMSGGVLNQSQAKSALRSSSSGAAVVIEQNNNFALGVSQTVQAELYRMLPQIARVTQSSVEDAQRRRVRP